MADAITLVKAPEEKMSKFNARLLQSCGEAPITSAQMAIIDGQPVVTLFSETVEADAEDVAEAKEAGEKIQEGDIIPSDEPVCVQVSQMHAQNVEGATKTQERMETLFRRADGAVTAVLHASGKGIVRVNDPATKKDVLIEKDLHYAAVVYNPPETAPSKDESDADAGGVQEPADG